MTLDEQSTSIVFDISDCSLDLDYGYNMLPTYRDDRNTRLYSLRRCVWRLKTLLCVQRPKNQIFVRIFKFFFLYQRQRLFLKGWMEKRNRPSRHQEQRFDVVRHSRIDLVTSSLWALPGRQFLSQDGDGCSLFQIADYSCITKMLIKSLLGYRSWQFMSIWLAVQECAGPQKSDVVFCV